MNAIGPTFAYFTAWMVLCGCAFLFFGFETGKRAIAASHRELHEKVPAPVAEYQPSFSFGQKCVIVPGNGVHATDAEAPG